MCKNCYTFRKLADDFVKKIRLEGHFIASLSTAWDLANVIMGDPDEDGWYDMKVQLWKDDRILCGKDMVHGEALPDNYWEVYEKVDIHGYTIYRIS